MSKFVVFVPMLMEALIPRYSTNYDKNKIKRVCRMHQMVQNGGDDDAHSLNLAKLTLRKKWRAGGPCFSLLLFPHQKYFRRKIWAKKHNYRVESYHLASF
jgi:hypothetical protein